MSRGVIFLRAFCPIRPSAITLSVIQTAKENALKPRTNLQNLFRAMGITRPVQCHFAELLNLVAQVNTTAHPISQLKTILSPCWKMGTILPCLGVKC